VLRRIAYGVEAIVAVVFLVTVVLLFTNEPTKVGSTTGNPAPAVDAYGLPIGTEAADGSAAAPAAPAGPDGAAIYAQRCSTCHGDDGGGGIGPALADGRMVERFPDAADQVAIVVAGRGQMPSFSDRGLTAAEIEAVVEFTRTSLTEG
jgi:mono/diheme cytochrome c family protein